MISKRTLFCSFVATLQHHYRARLVEMFFPRITDQILDFVLCLYEENLITGYSIAFGPKDQVLGVYLTFRYISNNDLLFSKVSVLPNPFFLTKKKLFSWLGRKVSLLFPILILETPQFGIVTDRFLFQNGILRTKRTFGGKLLAVVTR